MGNSGPIGCALACIACPRVSSMAVRCLSAGKKSGHPPGCPLIAPHERREGGLLQCRRQPHVCRCTHHLLQSRCHKRRASAPQHPAGVVKSHQVHVKNIFTITNKDHKKSRPAIPRGVVSAPRTLNCTVVEHSCRDVTDFRAWIILRFMCAWRIGSPKSELREVHCACFPPQSPVSLQGVRCPCPGSPFSPLPAFALPLPKIHGKSTLQRLVTNARCPRR